MSSTSKIKICVTGAAVAIACAGAYAFFRKKYGLRDAVYALNYLDIRSATTEEACDAVVDELRSKIKLHRAVGFDCEWVTENGSRQPVALVQLSTFDGLCGLFRLSHLKSMPQSLKAVLEDENIYKVGVAACDDAKYLQLDYSVFLQSTLDIRHVAALCGYTPGGLEAMAKSLLGVTLDKSWRVRCSNWEADTLTDRQISYAAADAHVAIKIFVNLINGYGNRNLAWLFGRKEEVWSDIDSICWKYVDLNYKVKHSATSDYKKLDKGKQKNGKIQEGIKLKKYPHATRSKPLYHNCFLQAPDGEMLCTCDNKKALWYVAKNLATIVGENPLTVRLRFEPAGRSLGDVGRYYQLTKENKCVVCGATNSYIRKNVVPREYRKYFPEIMKDHSSHDVVLLCVGCHQASNIRDQTIRKRLAEQCAAPLGALTKCTEDADCKKIRSAARALLNRAKHVLPEGRRKELEDILLQHYPEHSEITEELLQIAAHVQVVIENPDYESYGQKVVEHYLRQEGGLLRLEQVWREHFLTSMRPKYMPDLWSIRHNEERIKMKWDEGRLSEQDMKLIGITKWL